MKGLTLFGVALLATITTALTGCGRNEPGTMGGEPGAPETVATGAPKIEAEESTETDASQPALRSEHASSSFDDAASTNVTNTVRPDASTLGQDK